MLELRPYQRQAIDALYEYWAQPDTGNGLIVLPTGAGKALVIAKIIEELLRDYPGLRIINITHSASLVEQNFKEFLGLSPFAPAGIYSASLGRRDARSQVLFCNIQSVANRVDELGDMDLVLVDEAHAIGRNVNTQYGRFFRAFKKRNPEGRVAGTTATDYRMDSGRLTDDMETDGEVDENGKPVRFKLFDDVVFEIGIGELIEAGYLTTLTNSLNIQSKIDLKGVGTRGGEYIPGQLSDAAERIIEEAVAEDMVLSEGRRAGLFFSTSKENARHIASCIERHGRRCAVLTSDNAHQTKEVFEGFRSGKYWAISSVSMITTGTNFPFVDFISLILSTKSPGKLVQILGRGTRNSPGKTDCLIADHGKNLAYHGPIDQIRPKAPGSGDGEQPRKLCPQDQVDVNGKCGCGELIPIHIMTCQCCGYVFPPSEEEKITAQADTTPVLSSEKNIWRKVTKRPKFSEKQSKTQGHPPSVQVDYTCGFMNVRSWLCPQHHEHPQAKSQKATYYADRYWRDHGGLKPYPKTVADWLVRQHELRPTEEIEIEYNGRYPNAKNYRAAAANNNQPPAANDNELSAGMSEVLDGDYIPF